MDTANLTRDEVDDRYKWGVSDVYDSREVWEQDVEMVREYVDRLESYEGRVLASPEMLHEALLLSSMIDRKLGRLYFYAEANKRVHMGEEMYQEMCARASSLSAQVGEARSFLTPEILDGDYEEVMAMVDAYAPLQVYGRSLEEEFRAEQYVLPREQEEMVSRISEVIGNEGDMRDALLTDLKAREDVPVVTTPDGEEVQVTPATRNTLLKKDDRGFRQEVFELFGDHYQTFDTLHAALYQNRVKTGETFAGLRDFESKRHRALYANDIPESVYDSLIAAVRDNLDVQDVYYELLADSLGVDQLQPWDTYMSLTGGEGPEIGFEEAFNTVLASLEPLGDEYREVIVDNADTWIDVYPHQGKRGGAFSWGTYDTEPFLMLNHTDDVSSMYTLAHELGHSMHSHLSNTHQPYQTAGYPIFSAEVASTVHEALLSNYLLEAADAELRPHILNEQIQRIRGTMMTQAMFSEFEHTAHQRVQDGEPLTAETLNTLYQDLLDAYNPGVAEHPYHTRGWMRIPHFYRPYYVYQYATGISAALGIADAIQEEGEPAAERHKSFLASGDSRPPLELLQEAGVDLTTPEPVERGIDQYRAYLDEMAAV